MDQLPAPKPFFRRGRRWLLILASLIVLYASLGFLALPALLKAQLPRRLGALLGRPVAVDRVRTNPFALSLTLEGFRIQDPDGEALLAWDRLYVNAKLWPLLRGRLEFKAIELERPHARVVLEKGGRLNFSDIVERLSSAPQAGPPAPAGEPMRLVIDRLRVDSASLAFLDRSLAQPFASELGPLSFGLDGFRTERDATSPYSFRGRTEAGEGFAWTGTVGIQPLQSRGTLELNAVRLAKYAPYYREQVPFELKDGKASAKASYEFEWSGERHALRLQDGTLALEGLALAEKGTAEPALRLPSIEAEGLAADLLAPSLALASVTLKGAEFHAERRRDGLLNLARIFTPKEQPKPDKPSEFRLAVGEIRLADARGTFVDQAPARPVTLALEHVQASLKDLSLDPGQVSSVELAANVGARGTLQARGKAALLTSTGEMDLKLQGMDLPPFDPYFDAFANTRLSRGQLGLDGHLRYAFPGKAGDGIDFGGNVQITDFEARDGDQNEPFLRWKRLRLTGAEFHSLKAVSAVKRIDWDQPEARLVLAKEGGSNVTRALRIAAASPAAAAVPPTPPGPSPVVRIARLGIDGGRLSFIDRSVEPNAALLLGGMTGTYTGLSTEAEEATQVDFHGLAGGFAPITIQGRAMPLRHDKDTDVTIRIQGADLTDFSPYTGKYLGYTTREGKLELDARIRIQDRKLAIEDKVRLVRMYLGDKVDSPDATHLPVKLGLAILRDRKGVIELDVPIDGSLDDPDIHYGKLVWKAIFNVLGKIITSPFTLLSKLFGSGSEDLSAIVFAPGSLELPPAEAKKLQTLAKSLAERPELRLELEGATDATDSQSLRRQALERLLKKAKWDARKVKVPPVPEEEVIEAAEREQWLRAAYEAAFHSPSGSPAPPLAEVEQKLLEAAPVDPEVLRSLADARAKAALQFLLQEGQADPGQVFITRGGEAAKGGGAKVFFSLK